MSVYLETTMYLRISLGAFLSTICLLTGCKEEGVCVVPPETGTNSGPNASCRFGGMDKAVCDINKGTLHPYHAEDKGGEYEKGKDTCRKLGFESCGSDSCTVLKD